MIDIEYVDGSSITEPLFKAYLARLPSSCQHETLAYKAFFRQKESALGKLLVYRRLWPHGGGAPAITRAPGGKPQADGAPFFSISHSRGLVCAAFCAEAEIGVDIEAVRRVPPRLGRFFHAAEKAHAAGAAAAAGIDDKAAFFYLWTRKEAFLKARGSGWTTDAGRYNCAAPSVEADGALWHLASFRLRDTHFGAVCAAAAPPVFRITELAPAELL